MVEIGGGDLGHHSFQFGSGVGGYSPLHKAEIAAAERSQLTREPLLLLDPLESCQPIVVFIASIDELTSRACCAATALNQHLVAALGIGQSHHAAEKSSPAIGGADQQRGKLWTRARRVMIREQDGSIRHGNLHVACDHNIVRFSRWQVHPPGEETTSQTHRIQTSASTMGRASSP